MGIIAPSQGGRKNGIAARNSFADQKRWISNEFYQALNEFTTMDDGSRLTKIQAAVRSVVDSMVDAEADPYYRLAALKFVTEHLEGKASAMKDEVKEEMPKFAIVIGDVKAEEIRKAVGEMDTEMRDEGIFAEISDEDGGNRQEVMA